MRPACSRYGSNIREEVFDLHREGTLQNEQRMAGCRQASVRLQRRELSPAMVQRTNESKLLDAKLAL